MNQVDRMLGANKRRTIYPMPKKSRYNRVLGIVPTYGLRDSDGDGVPNATDCQRHNPNKQGIWHKLKGRFQARGEAKEEVESEEYKTADIKDDDAKYIAKHKARYVEREREKIAVKKAYQEARSKERIKLASERGRKSAQSGGFFGGLTSGFSRTGGRKPVAAKATYRYVKKGKHYVRQKVKSSTQRTKYKEPKYTPYTVPSISDTKFDMPRLFK